MDHSQHSQSTLSEKQALEETDIASQKASEIFEACKWRDTTRLRLLAESPGGFLADECRRVACKWSSHICIMPIDFFSTVSFFTLSLGPPARFS